jgi:hypothetical protein
MAVDEVTRLTQLNNIKMDNSEKLTLYSLFKQVQNGDAKNHASEYEN